MISCKFNQTHAKMCQRRCLWGVEKMKKLGILLLITAMILGAMPGIALATTYNNDVPSGLTLLAWVVGPNQNGKSTGINFVYSGGFNAPMIVNVPFDSSWHSLDDVRPILLAEQEGYGNYLGGTNGSFGSNIKFSDNVLAAMKVQNFNPSQVGGANISPSSITLNSDQIAWLQKVGYSVQSSSQPTKPQVQTPAPVSTQTSQPSKSNSQSTTPPSTVSSGYSASSSTSTSVKPSSGAAQATVKPSAGETVKTPSGIVTPQMAAADMQLAAQNPPRTNPANIPTKIPVKEEQTSQGNIWLWPAVGIVVLALGALGGRIFFKRRAVLKN